MKNCPRLNKKERSFLITMHYGRFFNLGTKRVIVHGTLLLRLDFW